MLDKGCLVWVALCVHAQHLAQHAQPRSVLAGAAVRLWKLQQMGSQQPMVSSVCGFCCCSAALIIVLLFALCTMYPCAGPSSQQAVEAGLGRHISQLHPDLRAKLASGKTLCIGPATSSNSSSSEGPAEVVAAALVAAAAAAPPLPLLHHMPAAELLQCLTLLLLREGLLAAAAQGPTPADVDVLAAFVAAHQGAVEQMAACLQQQLDSPATAWGYPPTSYSSSSSNTLGLPSGGKLQAVLQALSGMQLPPPPLLQQFYYDPDRQAAVSAADAPVAQLRCYLAQLEELGGPLGLHAAAVWVLLRQRLPQHAAAAAQGRLRAMVPAGAQHQQQLSGVVAACEELLGLLAQDLMPLGSVLLDQASVGTLQAAVQEQEAQGMQQQVAAVLEAAAAAAAAPGTGDTNARRQRSHDVPSLAGTGQQQQLLYGSVGMQQQGDTGRSLASGLGQQQQQQSQRLQGDADVVATARKQRELAAAISAAAGIRLRGQ